MKLLIFGDSHKITKFDELYELHNPDISIHTGDSELDSNNLNMKLITYKVKGNCDFSDYNLECSFKINEIKFLVTHGHLNDLSDEEGLVLNQNCDVFIHGHTHVAKIKKINDKLILNPGSLKLSRTEISESYMVLEVKVQQIKIFLYDYHNHNLLIEEEFNVSV